MTATLTNDLGERLVLMLAIVVAALFAAVLRQMRKGIREGWCQ